MKKKLVIIIILFLLPNFVWADFIDDLRAQIQAKDKEFVDLIAQSSALQTAINQKTNEKQTLSNRLFILSNQIKKFNLDIRVTETKIEKTNLEIKELTQEIADREDESQTHKSGMIEAIKILNNYDQENLLAILFKNQTLSDFLNQAQNFQKVQVALINRLSQIKKIKINLEDKKDKLHIKKSELDYLNRILKNQKILAQEEQQEKNDLLKQTKDQEKLYQQQLTQVREQQENIEKEIYELEDKIKFSLDPSLIPKPGPGIFIKPAEGRISQGYGRTRFAKRGRYYSFHNGVDFANNIGTPIIAARDGRIIGIGDDGQFAYGKWIAVIHDNNLVTLYGHLSLQSVNMGQQVKKGDIIGYMGQTGYATGPHVHFGVYVASTFRTSDRIYGVLPLGASLDPMDYF